jgi:tetratricopeptide (TPR) repeat protein
MTSSVPAKLQRILLLAITALVLIGSGAVAEELPSPTNPEARAHLAEGNKAYRLKEFDLAITEYRAGAALLEARSGASFTFWWNLGQAYRMLARYEEATWFYQRFLGEAPLTFPLHREAAHTFVDEMKRELEKAATKTGPIEPAPSPIGPESPPSAPASAPDPARPTWYADRPAWALTGAGALTAAVGAGYLWRASSLYGDADDEDRQATREDLRDRARTRAYVGGIAGGVGVALLAVGVTKLVLTPATHSTERVVQVDVGPSWVGIQGSF